MTVVPAERTSGGGGSSGLYDVLELVLDRGLVIDAFIRVSLVGIEILKIDVRVVVASVDTYLRFAEACNRLDLESGPHKSPGLPEIVSDATENGARDKTKGALSGAGQAVSQAARGLSDTLRGKGGDQEEESAPARSGTRRSTAKKSGEDA
ncbi:gas vesicle structural protein GvpA [Streptomyces sp. NPDC018031]|uniref:gas vesicle structural protein GvpA n=1 Tax=Streptomyces sp. NPDC018031 TaxID=3365033 RepID=UPI003788B67E